jgi:hypothetical protein
MKNWLKSGLSQFVYHLWTWKHRPLYTFKLHFVIVNVKFCSSLIEAIFRIVTMIAANETSVDYESVPLADLPTIDFEKLKLADEGEIVRLLGVCKSLGFFYLDFANGSGQKLISWSREVRIFMKKYFNQPLETKLRDMRHSVTHG